jgi:hypothetical protein
MMQKGQSSTAHESCKAQESNMGGELAIDLHVETVRAKEKSLGSSISSFLRRFWPSFTWARWLFAAPLASYSHKEACEEAKILYHDGRSLFEKATTANTRKFMCTVTAYCQAPRSLLVFEIKKAQRSCAPLTSSFCRPLNFCPSILFLPNL